MIEKAISFFSENHQLRGSIYYPENFCTDRAAPAIVVNSGYQGFNEFYPKMLAGPLTELGYVCLGFDYRGMADSDGEKGRVLLEEQAQDVRNAVTFIAAQPEVDPRQVCLVGWGMGAANVILAAEKGRSIAAVAALNGFYNGKRWLQSVHTYDRYVRILDEVHDDRLQRVTTGSSRLTGTFEHYLLDPSTSDYVQTELASVYGFGHPTQMQFTESILDLDVDAIVAKVAPIPIFIGHGTKNALHPYSEATALYAAAAHPKTLYDIEGRHNDFMYADHPEVIRLCAALDWFFRTAISATLEQHHTLYA